MRSHHIIVILLTLAALIGGLLLLPRPEEQVTMLLRDGRFESALRDLESMYARGDRRLHIVSQLAAGNANAGQPEKAIAYLEEYIASHPREPAPRRQIAKLYLSVQRVDDYINALEVTMTLSPSGSILRRLLGLYRLYGKFDAEERLLVRYLDRPYVQVQDLVRAGSIFAAKGELEVAKKALLRADEKLPFRDEFARTLLLDVLLRSGAVAEASSRALKWVQARRKTYLAVAFAKRFARAGFEREAIDLVAGVRVVLPRVDSMAVHALANEGYIQLAQQILKSWSERIDGRDGGEVHEYVSAAVAAGDAAGPYHLLERLVRKGAPASTQAVMAEELAMAFGLKGIAPVRSLISYETLASRPLFAADLAIAEGNLLLARRLLGSADPHAMPPRERARWFALLLRVEPDFAVYQRLLSLWTVRKLPRDLLAPLAQLALELGRTVEYNAIWREIGRRPGT